MEVILLLVVYMSWNKQNYSLVSVLLSLYQANMRTIALKVPGKGPEEPVSASSAAAIKLWAFIYLHNCFLEYMKYLSSYNCDISLKYHCCPPRKTKHTESNRVVWLLPCRALLVHIGYGHFSKLQHLERAISTCSSSAVVKTDLQEVIPLYSHHSNAVRQCALQIPTAQ